MKIRALVVFLMCTIGTIIGVPSLLAIATTTVNNTNNNNQILNQAFATHMNTANSTETTVLHQGIIASGKPPQVKTLPNETIEVVTILPFRSDGAIYRGTLTYTATKPVEVTLGHRIPVDNTTLSQLETQRHGKLFVRHLAGNVDGNVSAPSKIIPDYRGGTSSPYFSASIPFVASQVVLRSNEPFIAAYEVSADIVQPKIIKHLENATINTNTNTTNTNNSAIG
jgi:hypothetical protein